MAIDFPCNLPAPLASQNQVSPQSVVRMQQVAGGAPYAELFSSDSWTSYSVAWSLSELQYQVFVQWFRLRAGSGSKTINMPLKDSLGLTTKEVYMPSYSARQNQRRWLVSANVVSIKQEKMEECEFDSLLAAFEGFEDVNYAVRQFAEIMANYPDFADGNI